jgi:hypothetical protein
MTVHGQFPRMSRAVSVTAAAPVGVPAYAGLFFVPALAALAGAAVRLWREEP